MQEEKRYCSICHKSKALQHFIDFPEHARARSKADRAPRGGHLILADEDEQAAPPPRLSSAARTPRAPRVPVGAAPYDTSQGGSNAGLIFLGVTALGGIGYGIYRWWKSRGEAGGAAPGGNPPPRPGMPYQ